MNPPLLKRSKLPDEQKEIARRIREERRIERFSQAELGADSGLGRASLSNYEYGLAPLPFGAGIKLCRRLDLNPQWLATGREPKHPYVPLTDLGLKPESEELYGRTFLEGFRELLAAPLRKWAREQPPEVSALSELRGGADKVFARMSKLSLERFIREWSAKLREHENERMKLAVLANIETAVAELRRRLS